MKFPPSRSRAFSARLLSLLACTLLMLGYVTSTAGMVGSNPVYLPVLTKAALSPVQATLRHLGGFDTDGLTLEVAVGDGVIYAADGEAGGLKIVDLRDPQGVRMTRYDTPGSATSVQVVGAYAYIGDETSFLILDIGNPAAPRLVSSLSGASYYGRVRIFGNHAYISNGYAGFSIIDITNPATPRVLGSYDVLGFAGEVQVVGNLAYVVEDHLHIVDVSDPTRPRRVGILTLSGGGPSGVHVIGNVAYVAGGLSGLHIIDVHNPAAPVLISTFDTPGSANAVRVVDGIALISDLTHGIQLVDVRDATQPRDLGSFPPYDFPAAQLDYAAQLVVVGDVLYVADRKAGIQLFQYAVSNQ